MRTALAGMAFATVCLAQVVVNGSRLPPEFRSFEPVKGESPLQCEVERFQPRVDFGFRFQTGYAIRMPYQQFFGPGHTWGILTRVTPEGGTPVFLLNGVRLPDVPKTTAMAEVSGSFLVGEGRYSVDLLLIDDKLRTCRKQWKVEAKRKRAERNMAIRIPAGTVRSTGSRHVATKDRAGERPHRVTVLVHAAPIFPRSNRLRFFDREMLLGTLGPLLEQLPAQSVHLVMFNLTQQKTLLDKEQFKPEELDQVGQALNGLELGTVNYTVLQNREGHVELLTSLINRELEAKERADAVIVLGPVARYFEKFPQSVLVERSGNEPTFYYLQYRLFMARGGEFPDLIQNAMKAVRGKTLTVHTPREFSNALRQIDARIEERATSSRQRTSQ